MERGFCKRVSIIVPVYKVEDVLPRCLDSLCRQSLRDIEIVLIDDASPDRCGEICKQYAAEDSRIRILHHSENRGLSAARNTGIAHATAEYVMFVDSDDWVHEDFCKLPYECAVQQHADLVLFDRRYISQNDSPLLEIKAESQGFEKLTRLEALQLMFHKLGPSAWNMLYSKKLFNTVSYPEGYYYEDVGTTYKAILLAGNIYFLDKVLYYHCNREGSITTLKTEKALRDHFKMSLEQYRDLSAWGYPRDELDLRLYNIALNYCIQKKADPNDASYISCREILQSAETVPKGFTWKRKVLFVLLKYWPSLFNLACILYNKRFC